MRYILLFLLFCSVAFGSLVIDADNESVTISDHANLTLSATYWTVAFWIKSTDADPANGTYMYPISWGTYNSYPRFHVYIEGDGDDPTFQGDDSADVGWDINAASDICTQAWVHICLIRDGNTNVAIYINGTSAANVDPADTLDVINCATAFYIGERSDEGASRNWLGKIAEFAIWNDALLTETDIDQLSGTNGEDVTEPDQLTSATAPDVYLPLYDDDDDEAGGITTATNNASFDTGDHPLTPTGATTFYIERRRAEGD